VLTLALLRLASPPSAPLCPQFEDAPPEEHVTKSLSRRRHKHARKQRAVPSELTVDHRYAAANLHMAFRNMTFCQTIAQRLQERSRRSAMMTES